MTDLDPELAAEVAELLRHHVDCWNRDDLDAMFARFTPDAHWVNIVGMHWQGRHAVERAHRALFDLMFKGVDQRLEAIESIVPIDGGGAIVVARLSIDGFTQPDGVFKPASEDRMTLVLVPGEAGLMIKHGANVGIVAEAQRHDPVSAG